MLRQTICTKNDPHENENATNERGSACDFDAKKSPQVDFFLSHKMLRDEVTEGKNEGKLATGLLILLKNGGFQKQKETKLTRVCSALIGCAHPIVGLVTPYLGKLKSPQYIPVMWLRV